MSTAAKSDTPICRGKDRHDNAWVLDSRYWEPSFRLEHTQAQLGLLLLFRVAPPGLQGAVSNSILIHNSALSFVRFNRMRYRCWPLRYLKLQAWTDVDGAERTPSEALYASLETR